MSVLMDAVIAPITEIAAEMAQQVHKGGPAMDHAWCAAPRLQENSLVAVFRLNSLEFASHESQRLIPSDANKAADVPPLSGLL